MQHTAAVALVLAAAAFVPACSQARVRPEGEPRLELSVMPSGQRTVDVAGLPAEDLAYLEEVTLTRDEWTAILRVEVEGTEPASSGLPPVVGVTAVSNGVLRFTPRFPLDPGQRYDVVFDPSSLPSTRSGSAKSPARLSATLEVPDPARTAPASIVEVYPTAPEVPENHLRLYIVFSAPMSYSGSSPHIYLIDNEGRTVPDPFLPLELDLWNEDRTRFTVLYDPGRVKRGIRPNEEMGRALVAGQTYTLVVDGDWRDAAGQSLASVYRREFRVGPPQERAIDPDDWRLALPGAGTQDPLTVSFPIPLDYGLLQRALGVVTETGQRLDGEIRVEQAETRWLFTPRTPWQPGEYRLVASSTLEDVAGNRIGRPFEVSSAGGSASQTAKGAALPFLIRPETASR